MTPQRETNVSYCSDDCRHTCMSSDYEMEAYDTGEWVVTERAWLCGDLAYVTFPKRWYSRQPKEVLSGYCPACGSEVGFLDDGTPYRVTRKALEEACTLLDVLDNISPEDVEHWSTWTQHWHINNWKGEMEYNCFIKPSDLARALQEQKKP